MENNNQKLSVLEKIGYSLGDFAANLVFQTLMTYLAFFYTDIYGLKNTDASIIMLSVGLVAAFVFNPIIGILADRTKSKWGKFRPWILFTAVPLGIVAVLAFSTPDFSYKGKLIYSVVTYTLLLILYASSNLPYSALSAVLTGNMSERNSISSYRFVAVMVAQFFVQVFMLPIIIYVGNGEKAVGIEIVMTGLAIIGTVMLLITFVSTRERIIPTQEQNSSMGADFSALFKNKPWLIMLTVTILVFISLALKNGSHIYYFENYVDKKALSDFISPVVSKFSAIGFTIFDNDAVSAGFGLFNSCGISLMIIGILFSKRLADKFGKRDVFKYALLISAVLVFSFIFVGSNNVAVMFLLQSLFGFFYGITIPILWAMVADVADYMEWKMNRRATALTFSAMMVGLKAGLSIGGALVVSILNGYGYLSKGNATISTVIEQSPSVAIGTKMLVSAFSALPFFISVVLMFFYVIDKKMENRIEIELKQSRKK